MLSGKTMGYHSMTATIAEDNYALGWVAGERVIITQACILGEEGSEWEG